MSEQFVFKLYTLHTLDQQDTLAKLWDLLQDDLIDPVRFDGVERARRVFSKDSVADALEIFQDRGSLFVKGNKDKFLAHFSSFPAGINLWEFYVDTKSMAKKKADLWMQWVASLCREFPVLFGLGCSESEFFSKHSMVRSLPGGGRVTEFVGASIKDFRAFLPGVYWLNIYGQDIVAFFGAEKIKSIPGITLPTLDDRLALFHLADQSPVADALSRQAAERIIARTLGEEYFFDITQPDQQLTAIPNLLRTINAHTNADT